MLNFDFERFLEFYFYNKILDKFFWVIIFVFTFIIFYPKDSIILLMASSIFVLFSLVHTDLKRKRLSIAINRGKIFILYFTLFVIIKYIF